MLLSIKNLYKSFNDTVVLNDVNFSVDAVRIQKGVKFVPSSIEMMRR